MTRLEELIAAAERLLASTQAKAASEPDNLLAKLTLASTQAQLDDLRRQHRQAKAARPGLRPGDSAREHAEPARA